MIILSQMRYPKFEQSFASIDKSKFWSEKNTVKPRDLFKNSNIKYIFECEKCKHSFKSRLYSVTSGKWCPFCTNKKLCKNECDTCFKKSFASHLKIKFWSNENTINPRDVFKSSYNSFWFDCKDCNLSFKIRISEYSKTKYSCPFCKKS